MCDPLTATVLGLAAGAGAIGLGSSAASDLANVQNTQNQANTNWAAYQTKIHDAQALAEDQARAKATGAAENTLLNRVSPQAQGAAQTAEQQRLNTLYSRPGAGTGQDPNAAPSNLLLSGEGSGNSTFMGNLTQQVNRATSAARQRIAALATAGSYGGSFGGLGTTVPIAFAQGGNAINLENAIRQGDLKTYGVEQQVQPINYTIGPGTTGKEGIAKALGGIAGTLIGGGVGGGGLGSLGSMFGLGSSTAAGLDATDTALMNSFPASVTSF